MVYGSPLLGEKIQHCCLICLGSEQPSWFSWLIILGCNVQIIWVTALFFSGYKESAEFHHIFQYYGVWMWDIWVFGTWNHFPAKQCITRSEGVLVYVGHAQYAFLAPTLVRYYHQVDGTWKPQRRDWPFSITLSGLLQKAHHCSLSLAVLAAKKFSLSLTLPVFVTHQMSDNCSNNKTLKWNQSDHLSWNNFLYVFEIFNCIIYEIWNMNIHFHHSYTVKYVKI